MSQNFQRNKSVPASVSDPLVLLETHAMVNIEKIFQRILLQMEDEILDKEMDKIFHDEKETLETWPGELDDRKKYYRC